MEIFSKFLFLVKIGTYYHGFKRPFSPLQWEGVCTLEWLKKGRHSDNFQHILHVFPKSPKKEEGKLRK